MTPRRKAAADALDPGQIEFITDENLPPAPDGGPDNDAPGVFPQWAAVVVDPSTRQPLAVHRTASGAAHAVAHLAGRGIPAYVVAVHGYNADELPDPNDIAEQP